MVFTAHTLLTLSFLFPGGTAQGRILQHGSYGRFTEQSLWLKYLIHSCISVFFSCYIQSDRLFGLCSRDTKIVDLNMNFHSR